MSNRISGISRTIVAIVLVVVIVVAGVDSYDGSRNSRDSIRHFLNLRYFLDSNTF